MSYILEALKRSERERGQGAVSPLTADLRIADPDAGRRHHWWPWAGAALVAGVLLGAAGWRFIPQGSSGHGVPPAQVAESAARTVARVPPVRTASRVAPAVAAIERARAPTPLRPETAAPRRPAHAAVHRAVAHPSPAPPPATTPAPRSRPPAAPARVAMPLAPPPPAPPVPRLDDLPASFRAQLPKLDIEVYVYSPRRALRWVLINLHKYREGEQLPGGEVLEEITSGGLVLRYAGRRFLVPRPG